MYEAPQSLVMTRIQDAQKLLSTLAKSLLYPNWKDDQYNEPPNPDAVIPVTWNDLNRICQLQQDVLNILFMIEDRRINRLYMTYHDEVSLL